MKHLKNSQYLFPDYVHWRFETAKPNFAWSTDLTSLPCEINERSKNERYKLLFIIDNSTGQVISYKLFIIKVPQSQIKKKLFFQAVKSIFVLEALKEAIYVHKINKPLIIMSDRGSEFLNKNWHTYIMEHPYLIGSMGPANSPTSNAVVERFNKKFKYELKDHFFIPAVVNTLRDLIELLERRVNYINTMEKTKKNCYLGTYKYLHLLEKIEMKEIPDRIGYSEKMCQQGVGVDIRKDKKKIFEQVKKISEAELFKDHVVNSLKTIELNQRVLKYQADQNLALVRGDTAEIIDAVTKKKKAKIQKKPLRNAAPRALINKIINSKPRRKQHRITHSRFVLVCAICYFTGMRLNECGNLQRHQIEELVETGFVSTQRSKTSDFHIYRVSESAKVKLNQMQKHLNTVFLTHITLNGNISENSLIRSVNKELNLFTEGFCEPISSHSFRIARITALLELEMPAEAVSQYIGHKSVQTTLRYNRFDLFNQKAIDILNKSDSE